MTISLSQATLYQQLTSCRVVSTSNLTATYQNGSNGVGATLVNSGSLSALVIDSISVQIGDRVLIAEQTNGYQNGIYVVTDPGSSVTPWILTRSQDLQSIGQILTGYFTTIGDGNSNKGTIYVITNPLPGTLGVDPINFTSSVADIGTLGTAAYKNASNNSEMTVASVLAPVTAGTVATFSDTSGTIQSGGQLGSAAFKNSTTSAGDPNVVSMHGTSTVGDMPIFADTAGTVKDSGVKPISNQQTLSGGSTTITLTDSKITISSILSFQLVASQNASTLLTANPTNGGATLTFSADPGTITVSYSGYTGTIS